MTLEQLLQEITGCRVTGGGVDADDGFFLNLDNGKTVTVFSDDEYAIGVNLSPTEGGMYGEGRLH